MKVNISLCNKNANQWEDKDDTMILSWGSRPCQYASSCCVDRSLGGSMANWHHTWSTWCEHGLSPLFDSCSSSWHLDQALDVLLFYPFLFSTSSSSSHHHLHDWSWFALGVSSLAQLVALVEALLVAFTNCLVGHIEVGWPQVRHLKHFTCLSLSSSFIFLSFKMLG